MRQCCRLILLLLAGLSTACTLRKDPPQPGVPQITGLYAEADIYSAVLQAAVANFPHAEGEMDAGIVECGFELCQGGNPAAAEDSDAGGVTLPSAPPDTRRIEARMAQNGIFTASATGLVPDSDYAFRAFVSNGVSQIGSMPNIRGLILHVVRK